MGGGGRNSQSPLRSKSPRRDSSSPVRGGTTAARVLNNIEPPPNTQGMNYGTYDRIEQAEFAKVIKDNIFLERELEGCKIEAALKSDFNLLDAFKVFDTRGSGNVSV